MSGGKTGRVVVFIGPSLPIADAGQLLDATFHGPARRGDIAAAAAQRPAAIALIDGLYERVPAVSHKEILWALECGVPVFGAASMGALRAVELDQYGMIGVGRVYEWLRRGRFAGDDAVAVAHLPAEHHYRPVSIALVDIVASLDAATAEGALTPDSRDRVEELAAALHYTERAWPRLWAEAAGVGIDVTDLRSWIQGHHQSIKAHDAKALLRRLAEPGGGEITRAEPDWHLAETIHWRRLRARSGRYDQASLPLAALDDAIRRRDTYPEFYFRALATQLSVALAHEWGVEFDEIAATGELQRHLDLDDESQREWAGHNDLDPDGLARLARQQAALDWAVGAFHDDTIDALPDVLRVLDHYTSVRDLASSTSTVPTDPANEVA